MQWSRNQIEAILELEKEGKKERVPISSLTMDFSLNSIPTCSVNIAPGKSVKSLQPNPFHKVWNDKSWISGERTNARVLMTIPEAQNKEYVVFDGYLSAVMRKRSASSVNIVAQIEHWLSDLHYSSCVSSTVAPDTPYQIIFRNMITDENAATGFNTGAAIAAMHITPSSIENDLWGNAEGDKQLGIKGLLTYLGNQDMYLASRNAGQTQKNDAALRALQRIEGGKDFGYVYGKPLALGISPAHIAYVRNSISKTLSVKTLNIMANHTMWDELIDYSGTFMFAIVPMIDRALAVPLLPNSSTAYKAIKTNEYSHIFFASRGNITVKGVGIYGSVGSSTGWEMARGRESPYLGVGGMYVNEKVKRGIISFQNIPPWMSLVRFATSDVTLSAGLGNQKVKNTAHDPGAVQNDSGQQENISGAQADSIQLIQRYARFLYGIAATAHRRAELQGILRFDLCPGSTVKIEMPPDMKSDDNAEALFAMVSSVRIVVSAEPADVMTELSLVHCRTEEENKDGGLAFDEHPLWKEKWIGAPLLHLG